ncbi:MAG: DegT/DnrJ/EryC1/StrS family aminotransferase [Oscillospiraceae bacterium]|jgi:dTDP-4-amino-4,6-dideoxygalactose transaminase|nr:DegT/DnrJ/EryC1/StrS family aminotransferase [Oscillospiraceae bacterium]
MKRQINFSPPDISASEIELVTKVLKSGWITTGPETKLFEKRIAEFCGVKRCICLNSATACLETALRLLGIGNGDEVITTAYTFSASCSVIYHVGATPVLVDVGENSFEMDYNKVFELINEKTKAIIAVDLGGVLCDYEKIFKIVNDRKNIFKPLGQIQGKIGRVAIIADAAHSFGAFNKSGRISGSIADFTAFSFHAVKNLTTAEGGALTWNLEDNSIYKEASLLSLHGQSKSALEKSKLGLWEYDIVNFGYKFNMTDINAALGLSQLERFSSIMKKRRNIVRIYNNILKNSDIKIYQNESVVDISSNHLYITNLLGKSEKQRNDIIFKMASEGIATNVHYKPLPLFTAYKDKGINIKEFPNALKIYQNELTLPLHTKLSDDDVSYVSDILIKILK